MFGSRCRCGRSRTCCPSVASISAMRRFWWNLFGPPFATVIRKRRVLHHWCSCGSTGRSAICGGLLTTRQVLKDTLWVMVSGPGKFMGCRSQSVHRVTDARRNFFEQSVVGKPAEILDCAFHGLQFSDWRGEGMICAVVRSATMVSAEIPPRVKTLKNDAQENGRYLEHVTAAALCDRFMPRFSGLYDARARRSRRRCEGWAHRSELRRRR